MPRHRRTAPRGSSRPAQGDRGVASLGRTERGNTIRDRLDTRERDRAGRERAHQQEQRCATEQGPVVSRFVQRLLVHREGTEISERRTDEAVADEDHHDHDVAVRRRCEQLPGLTDAAQVRDHQRGEKHGGGRDLMTAQRLDRGGDRRSSRRDRDRDRQRVVDEQRGARHEPGRRAEVVLADDVRPAPVRIRRDGLAVAEHHDREQHDDEDRDRCQIPDRGHTQHRHQDVQDLLRRERARCDRVRGEHREPHDLRQPFMRRSCRMQRRTDQQPLGQRSRGSAPGDRTCRPARRVSPARTRSQASAPSLRSRHELRRGSRGTYTRACWLIPVLVGDTVMPSPDEFPCGAPNRCRTSTWRGARPDPDFDTDADRLISAIERGVAARRSPPATCGRRRQKNARRHTAWAAYWRRHRVLALGAGAVVVVGALGLGVFLLDRRRRRR